MLSFFFKSVFFRGALTSKPYAFLARPWEFRSVDSIDVFDSLGSNIRVDVRGEKILRILPRSNDLINSDWISDKVRFICDAIRLQRIDAPILKALNSFYLLNWNQLFSFWSSVSLVSNFFNLSSLKHLGVGYAKNISPLLTLGLYLDLESSYILSRLNSSFFFNLNSLSELLNNTNLTERSNFLFNQALSNLHNFDSIFLVDCNLKVEAPVLLIYFRNLAKSGVKFYSFGKTLGSSQSFIQNLGSIFNFFDFLKGKHWLSNRLLKVNSFFLFDAKVFKIRVVADLFIKLNFKFGVFYNNLAALNSLESCLKTNFKFDRFYSSVQFLTNLSASHLLKSLTSFEKKEHLNFSTSLGLLSHGGLLADSLDVLVPISSAFEQSKNYLNILGLIQKTRLAVTSPNNVLDCSSVLMFYYLFLLCSKLELTKDSTRNLFFFSFLGFFHAVILNNSKSWEYINFFFKLIESNSLLISRLFDYFSNVEFEFKNLKVGEKWLLNNNDALSMPTKIFNTGLSGLKLVSALDFYQNDEISLVSSTLSAASKRLIDKRSFIH